MSAGVFTVLSRSWCHLCDEFIEALTPIAQEYGWRVEVIDVDLDEKRYAVYDEHIPVLFDGNVELCRHQFDAEFVREWCIGRY